MLGQGGRDSRATRTSTDVDHLCVAQPTLAIRVHNEEAIGRKTGRISIGQWRDVDMLAFQIGQPRCSRCGALRLDESHPARYDRTDWRQPSHFSGCSISKGLRLLWRKEIRRWRLGLIGETGETEEMGELAHQVVFVVRPRVFESNVQDGQRSQPALAPRRLPECRVVYDCGRSPADDDVVSLRSAARHAVDRLCCVLGIDYVRVATVRHLSDVGHSDAVNRANK